MLINKFKWQPSQYGYYMFVSNIGSSNNVYFTTLRREAKYLFYILNKYTEYRDKDIITFVQFDNFDQYIETKAHFLKINYHIYDNMYDMMRDENL